MRTFGDKDDVLGHTLFESNQPLLLIEQDQPLLSASLSASHGRITTGSTISIVLSRSA